MRSQHLKEWNDLKRLSELKVMKSHFGKVFSHDGFHCFCSFVLFLCFAMFNDSTDAFFDRCFPILRGAQRQKPERRDRRDLEPYPALTGTLLASLESENYVMSYLMLSHVVTSKICKLHLAPVCSFCSNSLESLLFLRPPTGSLFP